MGRMMVKQIGRILLVVIIFWGWGSHCTLGAPSTASDSIVISFYGMQGPTIKTLIISSTKAPEIIKCQHHDFFNTVCFSIDTKVIQEMVSVIRNNCPRPGNMYPDFRDGSGTFVIEWHCQDESGECSASSGEAIVPLSQLVAISMKSDSCELREYLDYLEKEAQERSR
jgi:hypothetical protein